MVHCCYVPDCSTRSDKETHLSFFTLPLKNKKVLNRWIHVIRRTNLPVNRHTRICSKHFVNANRGRLYPDEVPLLYLPRPSVCSRGRRRKPPRDRFVVLDAIADGQMERDTAASQQNYRDAITQTEINVAEELDLLRSKVLHLEKRSEEAENKLEEAKFTLSNIKGDDSKLAFYTGFPAFSTLKAFFNFLGPAVDNLKYSKKQEEADVLSGAENKRCRQRTLPPLEEFFMTLVRLRLGLAEQDLAYRFGISQSTVSRITCTWINFLYVKLKELPLWPPKELVKANMPKEFKERYPATRVILDATEIYIEQAP